MGWGFCIECNSCDYEEYISLGVGMMYCPSFENLMEFLPSKKRKKILKILEGRPTPDLVEFSEELFFCPSCRSFHSRLDYTIFCSDDHSSITPVRFRCKHCRKKLEKCSEEEANRLKERIREYPCPKCHEISLKIGSAMMWD
jgi:Zn finger protein HypA/HybF involved in hydrogenase expression